MCEATSIGLLDFKWSFLSGLWSVLCFLITMLLSMEPSLLSSDGIFIHASLIHALLKQLQLTCIRVPSINVVAPSSAPNGAFGHRRSISMMSHNLAPVQYGPIRNRIVPNVQSPSVAPYSPPHDQDDDIGGAPSRDTVHDVHLPAVIVARKMLRDDMAALTATLKTECEVLQPWICLEEAHLEKERSAFFAKRDLRTGRISRHISVQESLDVVFAKILAAEAKAAEAAHTADEAAGPSGVEAATPAAPLQGASSSSSDFKVPAAGFSSWFHHQRFRAGFRAPAPEVHSQMVQSQMVQRFIEGKADGAAGAAPNIALFNMGSRGESH